MIQKEKTIQQYLKYGEILKIRYLGCTWEYDDVYTYKYKIKYMELGE